MKKLTHLLNALLIATWMSAIALFSIQNIQAVSLRFFTWESIQLPIGVLLTFCWGGGLILAALLSLFSSNP